jgi:hypothetical protein
MNERRGLESKIMFGAAVVNFWFNVAGTYGTIGNMQIYWPCEPKYPCDVCIARRGELEELFRQAHCESLGTDRAHL